MKNYLPFLVAGLILVPSLVSAGPLYGTVRVGETPLVAATVLVACPAFQPGGRAAATASSVTDAHGSYSLRVQASGRCEMRIKYQNRDGNPFQVFVSENPLRIDLVLDAALSRLH